MTKHILLSDGELVSILKDGDRNAFGEIYNRYWKPLHHSAYNILGDENAASDVLQEVFVSLWHRRGAVEILSLKSYLFQAVRFGVLKSIRQQKTDQLFYTRLAAVTSEIVLENPMLFKEQQHLITQLISQLPEDCRTIFIMSREENLTYKQIANKLDISEKTVEKKMSISLRMIRKGLNLELCIAVTSLYFLSKS
ncbi:RNA polymerase sigma-70 factor [Pedobacter sp. ISL-68]|uniref:RNA polymerase sigma factor n=1 Tax=unclassified Pedobacter TaxID=2628915 RepID=UPI001BECFEE3|nr:MULTISPECIES: RNA polymerase sigma-70 factor [unclassified Pedobacter]MBT2563121.1 RNA polymerase sigma-70 factor [Pedobacter sp. ISL-64]MBT2593459.1 RNA polymerase sigma-70 factor [Pedobacter sp. ISL-68]